MANSVDPDETARYEPPNLDLHCLQRYLSVLQFRDERLNALNTENMVGFEPMVKI